MFDFPESPVAAKDRKKKCVSEQYVRERKSNANKQFAYNKLKNEKHLSLKVDQKVVPKRPPQPKIINVEGGTREGMLIDLSPPQQLDINFPSTSIAHIQNGLHPNLSILDAPIDIPTEGMLNDSAANFGSLDMFCSLETNKLEPPPYTSPPTYMNTYGLSHHHSNALSTSSVDFIVEKSPSSSSFDPFDTSHIATTSKAYNTTVMFDNLRKENKNMINKNQESTVRYRPSQPSPLDDLIQNTMASLSPKSSHSSLTSASDASGKYVNQSLNSTRSDSNQSAYGADSKSNASEDSTLNVSMQVNLSSLTLNDTGESLSPSHINANNVIKDNGGEPMVKKFDKSFLAELEKEMYKKDVVVTNINMNSSQSYASQSTNKDNTVNAIPSDIYNRTASYSNTNTRIYNDAIASMPITTMSSPSMSPAGKYTNSYTKSTNQDIASSKSNYESSTSRNYYTASPNNSPIILNKKQQNVDQISNTNKPAATVNLNQMWIDRQITMASTSSTIPNQTYSNEQAIYSNYSASSASNLYGNTGEQKHSFVAVSNRPSPVTKNPQQNNTRANVNLYNSITSDIYGSLSSGNIYDVVALPNAASANYYDVFSSSATATTATTTTTATATTKNKFENYYEAIPNNESQTVIYDEVAGEEMLRPHRPAPIAPPVLSAQQIQRRLDRKKEQMYGNVGPSTNGAMASHTNDLKSQQQVVALLNEISCDGCADSTEQEATLALQASNWDHGSAVHYFKIERLLRYVGTFLSMLELISFYDRISGKVKGVCFPNKRRYILLYIVPFKECLG